MKKLIESIDELGSDHETCKLLGRQPAELMAAGLWSPSVWFSRVARAPAKFDVLACFECQGFGIPAVGHRAGTGCHTI